MSDTPDTDPPAAPAKSGRALFAALLLVALTILLTGVYAIAYVTLGELIDWRASPYPEDRTDLVERQYPQGWLATIFEPAAHAESRWIDCAVITTYTETPGPAAPDP